jgi:shikimate kinase
MSIRKTNIYLMGFMGCGKTKIGTLLAREMGYPYIDTDVCIAEESGMSINAIFETEGESGFRAREKSLIERISRLERHVVSLGGGTVVDQDNWRILSESGTTIALSYPPEIIAARLEKKKDRPLLNAYSGHDRIGRIAALMAVRTPCYQKADLMLHMNHEVHPVRVVRALLGYLKDSV